MLQLYRLVCAFLVLGAVAAAAMDDHAARLYRSPIALGTHLSPSVFGPLTNGATDKSGAVIYVRYRGFTCSHCVRQLVYLNEHANALRRLGISVVAFSSDDARTSRKMVSATGLHADVVRVVSDPENDIARSIGALRVENDTIRDLHAVLVVRDGVLAFAAYTDEPFMDVERLIGEATGDIPKDFGEGSASGKGLRSYAGAYSVRTVATAADGVREPKDLDFNSSQLHPNDLWIVLAEPNGNAMLIIHDADKPSQVIRRKKDYRASHFMWRSQALAFGTNATFATAQNGEPGGTDRDYQFMGPTLWSSDTAIFASKNQKEDGMLASHLDMLHQNAYCLGIAHERDNVYWISDALHGTIGRYDFHDPHEVGGSDHRDGEIRNYTSATVSSTEHGRAAHMDFDANKRWLYFIDPGTNAVMRLDTRTGTDTRALQTTQLSYEYLASFREFTGSTVELAVQLTAEERPVGLDIAGDIMIVGNTNGTIVMYQLGEGEPTLVRTLIVDNYVVGGVTVGPDGRIWFVDPVNATVNVIDPALSESLAAEDLVRVTPTATQMSVQFSVVSSPGEMHTYTLEASAPDGWAISVPDSITVADITDPSFTINATPDSGAQAGFLLVRAISADGSNFAISVLISRSDLRRVVVNDATTESFDIVDAVVQTSRNGYSSMTSDIFLQLVDSLPDIQTVVWNSGSFGEINMAEDVVMRSLMASGREVMLIADDPLLLRTDLPDASGFFGEFGAQLIGADVPIGTDNGKRVFQGVPSDPISGGMSGLECELPRLDHARGGDYVPNVKMRVSKPTSLPVLVRSNNTITTAIRYDANAYRSVICGINLARFLDVSERTEFLDKSIAWLEQAETPIPDPTNVASSEEVAVIGIMRAIGPNPFQDATRVRVTATTPYADIAMYSIAGQRIATLWQGAVDGAVDLDIDGRSIANGTYYVIMRNASSTAYCTIVKRR